MKHLGDITKISGYEVPIVDVVVGGSPCQDLSVAGRREGLAGERSGLFMEQLRIIKEMRDGVSKKLRSRGSDEYIRPRYMVWENVPGAFSSNKGEDFRVVLEETARVADKTAVIPKPEGGGGNQQEPSWEMGGALLGAYMMHSFGESPRDVKESRLSQILEEKPHPKYFLSARACQGILRRATKRGKELPTLLQETLEKQAQLASLNELGVKGGVRESSSNTSEQEHSQPSTTKVYCLQGNGIDRADTAGCNGKGWRENEAYTLNTIDRHAVCHSQDAYDKFSENEKSASLKACGGTYGGAAKRL